MPYIAQFGVMISQAYVSLKRIADFLEEDEVPAWVSSLKRTPAGSGTFGDVQIGFEHASFKWNTGVSATAGADPKKKADNLQPATTLNESEDATVQEDFLPFELTDLNLSFPIGKFTVISGPTGSGKSATLLALLGEMDCTGGRVMLPKEATQIDPSTGLRNSVAYCSQSPWLRHQSIRENVLFGEKFDESRYQMTLEACALIPDLEVLEDGDETEVGVRVSHLPRSQPLA